MRSGKASRTAQFMALFRALESSRPPGARLFEDPFAQLFLSPPLRWVLRLSRLPLFDRLIRWVIDRQWPGARSSGVTRTRFIDDVLRAALTEGVEQLVILGAGFDCRAYRIAGIERVPVFEVDHPDTLAQKRATLEAVLASIPPHVRFIAIDFTQGELSDTMARAGYDATRRTFFIWEGVTNYLTEAAVDAAIRWFGQAAEGSWAVFTYVHRKVLADPASFIGASKIVRMVQSSGEPWTFGLEPGAVPRYLAERGLVLLEDLGAAEYRSRYLSASSASGAALRGYEFYRIAIARVRRM
jgi:methyltransferase (TIGR00027 family)